MRRFEMHLADTDENRSLYYARIIFIELKTASRLLWPVFLKNFFRYFSIY